MLFNIVAIATIREYLYCRFNIATMVKLHIKSVDEKQFLVETTVEVPLSELIVQLVRLHNGILKVDRLCQGWLMETQLNLYPRLYRYDIK